MSKNCLYLKASISKEPYELIKTLKATHENYNAAWNILEERYQHNRKIFEAHFNAILSLPILYHESYNNIKKLLDTYTSHMTAIESHGVPVDNAHPFIIHLLTQKFDPNTRKHWAEEQKGSKELPTKQKFISFLEMRICIMEGLDSTKQYDKNSYPQTSNTGNSFKKNPSFNNHKNSSNQYQKNSFSRYNTTPQTFSTQTNEERQMSCTICNEAHRPYTCPMFKNTDLKSKYQLVMDRFLCANCLYRHEIDKCKSKYRCNQCFSCTDTCKFNRDISRLGNIKRSKS